MNYSVIQEDLARAVKLFNRWQFQEAADAFEKIAQEIEGTDRTFFEAIAMLASGFFRIWNKGGEPNAMYEYVERGWDLLQKHAKVVGGLDVTEFYETLPMCLEEAARWRRGDVELFNRDFIPRIERVEIED